MKKSCFEVRRENLVIRGVSCFPDEAGKNLTPIILSHGFMSNHHIVENYAREAVLRFGFCAFSFDFCGGCEVGESDGKTTDMSVFTECDDLKAIISYVRNRKEVEPDQLILFGCSQGGLVSALTAVQCSEWVRALILFYPALCIPDDARKGHMMQAEFDPHEIPDVIPCGSVNLGKQYPESVMEMDPFKEIKGYQGPVLIVHGTKDPVVSTSYARKAYEVYKERTSLDDSPNPSSQLVLLDGAGHGFTPEYAKQAMDAVEQFLKKESLV